MAKTLGKIVIILLVVCAVSSTIYLIFSNTSLGSMSGQGGQQMGSVPSNSTSSDTNQSSEIVRTRPSGGPGEGSGGNASGILTNLAKVSAVTLTILVIDLVYGKVMKKRPISVPTAE
jgi:hypothetical protein